MIKTLIQDLKLSRKTVEPLPLVIFLLPHHLLNSWYPIQGIECMLCVTRFLEKYHVYERPGQEAAQLDRK